MSSEGNVSLKKMTLNCWIKTESLCHKKKIFLLSPEASEAKYYYFKFLSLVVKIPRVKN